MDFETNVINLTLQRTVLKIKFIMSKKAFMVTKNLNFYLFYDFGAGFRIRIYIYKCQTRFWRLWW